MLRGQPVGRASSSAHCIHSSAEWWSLRMVKSSPMLVAAVMAMRIWPVSSADS
jgi:hypothetical protein